MFKQSEMSSKLIIKAANQKHDDFLIENYEIEWTIKYLKDFLSQNYPKNPVNYFFVKDKFINYYNYFMVLLGSYINPFNLFWEASSRSFKIKRSYPSGK